MRSARKAVRSDLAEFIASSVTAELASLPLATESRTGESASLDPPRKFSSPVVAKDPDSGFDRRCSIAFILCLETYLAMTSNHGDLLTAVGVLGRSSSMSFAIIEILVALWAKAAPHKAVAAIKLGL
jgi:hypothetical protein